MADASRMVSRYTRRTEIPTSCAPSEFSAVARQIFPMIVRRSITCRETIATNAVTTTRS
jgi:hypothetical protein